ncbi:hypothetical protein D5086_011287 [Populus alba]|uniref:Uncharacterized protein n=1 Tax=Populus alba TaxID=43335 RepID=A0ACC4CEH1_POPAL
MNLKSSCYPLDLLIANIALACIDGALASVAFSQLIRIFLRNQQSGWTRQKVLHLMVGSCNLGYFIYFTSTIIATCNRWLCWSYACGFILMAFPNILFFAVFLLLLSFWVDLCHQANEEDDDDEENSSQQPLLESSKNKPGSTNTDSYRRCCSFRGIQVGSHQKFVIADLIVSSLNLLEAVNELCIVSVNDRKAEVYVDLFATAVLILGGALGCYGLILFLKLRKVRSETASSEMRKVAGLAVVSVVCFTSSAAVALLTDIPLLYHWSMKNINQVKTLVLLVFYYVIGSSVPSAFVLWVMRELPAPVTNMQAQSRSVTFISYGAEETLNPRHWVAATTSKNQHFKLEVHSRCLYTLRGKFAYRTIYVEALRRQNSEFYTGYNHKKEGFFFVTLVHNGNLGAFAMNL